MKKSRVTYFGGKKKVRGEAGEKSIEEIQVAPTAIEKVNYKTGSIAGYYYFGGKKKRSVFGYNPDIPKEEAEKSIVARRRFLRNVSRLMKITQLLNKASEDNLTDSEKIQLIKLDREFNNFEIIKALEREEEKVVQETSNGKKDTVFGEGYIGTSDPAKIQKPQVYEGKIQKGGKAGEEEKRLSAVLIKHKKAIGWSEQQYKAKLAEQRGAASKRVFEKRKACGLKETRGRKKGKIFDARVMKYITAKEKEGLDKK